MQESPHEREGIDNFWFFAIVVAVTIVVAVAVVGFLAGWFVLIPAGVALVCVIQSAGGIGNKYFRFLTGLVGLVALLYVADKLVESIMLFWLLSDQIAVPFSLVFILIWVAPPLGWGGLVYACWLRSGRITDSALALVLALGICGMAITFRALTAVHPVTPDRLAETMVFLTGIWILNGLGMAWIVHKVRRIRAASNTDAGDAAR